MAKGMFAQATVVLFKAPIALDSIKALLGDFTITSEMEAMEDWEISGPSILVEYKKDVNGHVAIDVVNEAWPDHMGGAEEPTLFGAWSMGQFGPFAYPGGLTRASDHSWNWEEGKTIAQGHKSFVRIKLSYIFGADADSPVMPEDNDVQDELRFLSRMASAILQHEEALCLFNPNGEVLLSRKLLEESIAYHVSHKIPPLDTWTNVRLWNLTPGWSLMDSIGCAQLDLPDQEVAFPIEDFKPEEVSRFIRNLTLYLLNKGEVIKDGDTMDGAGGRWQCHHYENGLTDPPRRVTRWLPEKAKDVPEALLEGERVDDSGAPEKKRKKWKLW